MEELATIDSMTGLYNRRHFWTMAAAEWSRFQRYYRPLSVLMIDVDHFKAVNDRYGHAVGDEVLVAVANACREGKRNSDIVGRIGGEEFAMLLPETDLGQARIVAERVRQSIAASALQAHEAHFNVTASIGFAAATASMSGFEALLHAADQALYQAKAGGRNRAVAWLPAPPAKLAAFLILLAWALVVLFPIYWLFVTSFKTPYQVDKGPFYIPFVDFQPTLDAWKNILVDLGNDTIRPYINTVIIGFSSAILCTVMGSAAAYALVLFDYRPRVALIVLAGVTMVAGYVPARHASRIDPVRALRAE